MASLDLGLELDPTEFSKATIQLEIALSLPVAEQGSSKKGDPFTTSVGGDKGSSSSHTRTQA